MLLRCLGLVCGHGKVTDNDFRVTIAYYVRGNHLPRFATRGTACRPPVAEINKIVTTIVDHDIEYVFGEVSFTEL